MYFEAVQLLTLAVAHSLRRRRTIAAVIAAGGSDESAYTTATVGFKSNLLFGVFLLYDSKPGASDACRARLLIFVLML